VPVITMYRGARAPVPAVCDDLSWGELCEEVEAMAEIEYANKIDMLAIGPHVLHPDDRRSKAERTAKPNPSGGPYRHLDNVAGVTVLVLDVDRCDLAALLERAAGVGVDVLVYASPSDDPDGPDNARRVRVLAPVDRPITVEECARTRYAFAEALGLAPGCGVEGAHEAARIFFIGRVTGTAPRGVWRFEA
jgi:hypothetical protein